MSKGPRRLPKTDGARDGNVFGAEIGPGELYDISSVPKNSKGGVQVTDAEITAAFQFFDVDGRGKVTTANLRKRLGVFYKDMPARDLRFLMNNKPELTEQDLRELLADNEVVNFDPVAEAFKCYDPHSTGYVDLETLRAMFTNLGFGEVTDDDLQILVETGDSDGDGRISLADFRNMLTFNQPDKPAYGEFTSTQDGLDGAAASEK
mmetsp:Transcript_75686/g.152079  ORF Transcript_75686/g.152079 Transcript_75686/m.152079 type:complete len:206 (-) Transcript_75686:133-750(-)